MLSIAILVTLVVAIVFATAKLKINPFLALLAAALVGGFTFGLPSLRSPRSSRQPSAPPWAISV